MKCETGGSEVRMGHGGGDCSLQGTRPAEVLKL